MQTKPGELTAKQRLFVDFYVINLNATEAAFLAGYKGSERTLQKAGAQNLVVPLVAAAIEAKQRPMLTKASVTHERTLTELARMAYADPRDLFSWGSDGVVVKESSELSEDAARAVMEVSETRSKDGSVTVRLKLHDKAKSLEMLARHLKLLGDALPVLSSTTNNYLVVLGDAASRAALDQLAQRIEMSVVPSGDEKDATSTPSATRSGSAV